MNKQNEELQNEILSQEDFKEYIKAVTESMEKMGLAIIDLNDKLKNIEKIVQNHEQVLGSMAVKY